MPSPVPSVSILVDLVQITVLIVTLLIVARQASLMRQANQAVAYKVVFDLLQDQEIRDARKHVLRNLRKKAFKKWSSKDIDEAEKVCQSFDAVGQMVRKKLVPKEWIIGNWLVGLRDSWKILEPLVSQIRADRDFPTNWDDYEYLANEAHALK